MDEKYISNHQKQCETSIDFPETPKEMFGAFLTVFWAFCCVFGEVQFNTIQNEKGTQAQDVTVVVAPHEASYFGEIKSFNPMKGRLEEIWEAHGTWYVSNIYHLISYV